MELAFLFVTQICVAILMIIFLHKITQVEGKLNQITKEVQNYLAFITEDETNIQRKEVKKKEASQNQLIQAVLREYFP